MTRATFSALYCATYAGHIAGQLAADRLTLAQARAGIAAKLDDAHRTWRKRRRHLAALPDWPTSNPSNS